MSSAEFDLPIVPSADQIRRREFATTRRGYDPDQVREYLKHVAAQVEDLEGQAKEAQVQAASAQAAAADAQAARHLLPEPQPTPVAPEAAPALIAPPMSEGDAYAEIAERMADVMRTAEQKAGETLAEAQARADRMADEARTVADRIRIDAQEKAEEVRGEADQALRRATEEADRMLSGLHSRRDALMAELEHMRERLLDMASSLATLAETPDGVASPAVDMPPAIRVPDSERKVETQRPKMPSAPPSLRAVAAPADENDPFRQDALEDLWADDEIREAGELQAEVDASLLDISMLDDLVVAPDPNTPSLPLESSADSPPARPIDGPTYSDPLTDRGSEDDRDDPWAV